jgi:hypothetical protein
LLIGWLLLQLHVTFGAPVRTLLFHMDMEVAQPQPVATDERFDPLDQAAQKRQKRLATLHKNIGSHTTAAAGGALEGDDTARGAIKPARQAYDPGEQEQRHVELQAAARPQERPHQAHDGCGGWCRDFPAFKVNESLIENGICTTAREEDLFCVDGTYPPNSGYPTVDNCKRMSRLCDSKNEGGLQAEIEAFRQSDQNTCAVCQLSCANGAVCHALLCATKVHVDCLSLGEQTRLQEFEDSKSVDWFCAACPDYEEEKQQFEEDLKKDLKKRKRTRVLGGRRRDIPWSQVGT